MVTASDKGVRELKGYNYGHWITTMWLVKRQLIAKVASYTVFRVDTDPRLQAKLKRTLTEKLQSAEIRIEPYSYTTADQDDSIYTLDTAETDFLEIKKDIQNGLANPKVKCFDELLDSWAYIIEISDGKKAIYGLRQINTLTKAKKVRSVSSLLFKDQLLVDFDEQQIFTIDTQIDCYEYAGVIFITNKKRFENALNFRKGMEDSRDTVLREFRAMKLFTNIEPLRQVIGNNLHLLRKVALVKKNGYYKDKQFIGNLKTVSRAEGWNVTFDGDRIVVTEADVDLVLTLLNNSRLRSPINQEVFDAIVKNKVSLDPSPT